MPEISDADFELLKLSQAALGKKETRLKTLRAFKEADPSAILPEIDTEDRIHSAVNPIAEENKKLREDLDKERSMNALEKKRADLRAKGYDVEAVEKVMLEKGITKHESAAEFLAANSKPAAPATINTWDRSAKVPAEEGLKKDPAQWARETAAGIIDTMRGVKK